MKRRWFGVILMVFASLGPLFAFAPTVYANSSGQCIPSSTMGCVTIKVHLNVTNTGGVVSTPATVTAIRQGNSANDNNFTLNGSGSNLDYTSGGYVWGTSPDDNDCAAAPTAPVNYFKFTVTGSATGSTPSAINMCANENPKASGGPLAQVKTVTIDVQANGGAGPTLGGIKGDFANLDLAGNVRACDASQKVTFAGGPTAGKDASLTTGTASGKPASHFDTGMILAPGKYTVNVNCSANGSAGLITLNDIVVTAGKVTDIGLNVCDAKANGCGLAGGLPGGVTAAPDAAPPPDCDAGGFTWVICGIIHLAVGAVDWIRDNIILPFLEERPLTQTSTEGAPLYKIWSAFRNLASVFFILIFFLIIFGTAFGMDNYTVKKTLPRLIAGAILVPFSWYICTFFIDLGNIIGQGMLALTSQLIPNPSINFHSDLSKVFFGGGIALVGAGVVGAIATVSLGVIFGILLALLAAFVTLIFRKVMIALLVMLSPFAVLAWILPNTTRWWNRWWTTLFRLVLMYPIILMLFEVGRLFAYAAGTIAAAAVGTAYAGGHPPFLADAATASVMPLVQLVCLFGIPGIGSVKSWDWSGAGLGAGTNAIRKGQAMANKKIGRDSDMAKDRAAARERNNLIRMDRAEKKGQTMRAAMYRARSGTGGGYGGLGKGGVDAQLRRNELKGAAAKTAAKYDAMKNSGKQMPVETIDQRIAAEQRLELDRIAQERAGRAGVLEAAGELAGNGTDITRQRYDAALTNARRGYGAGVGQDQAVNLAERANPQTTSKVAAHALQTESEKQAKLRGEVEGIVKTTAEIDAATVRAHGGDVQAAHIARLQGAAADAASAAKQHFTADHGGVAGRNEHEAGLESEAIAEEERLLGRAPGTLSEPEKQVVRNRLSRHRTATMTTAAALDARQSASDTEAGRGERVAAENLAPESTQDIITGSRLAAADKTATDKAARLERLQAADPSKGGRTLTRQELLTAARTDARTQATAAIGDKLAAIRTGTVARAEGDTIGTQIDAAAEVGEKRRSDDAGSRRGVLTSRDADRTKVAGELAARGITPTAAAVDRQRISERLAVAATGAGEQASAESGTRRSTLDGVTTAKATLAAEMAAAAGGTAPTAAQVEARYQQNLLQASGIKGAQDTNKKLGDRQGLLDSADQQNDNATDQAAARFATEGAESKAAGDRRGVVTGTLEARQRAIQTAADQGRTLSPAGAAAEIRATRGDAAEYTAERRATDDLAADAGLNEGVTRAEDKLIRKAQKKRGVTLSRDQARSEIMGTAAEAGQMASEHKTRQVISEAAGTVSGHAAAREELIAASGGRLSEAAADNQLSNSAASAAESLAETKVTKDIGAAAGTNRATQGANQKARQQALKDAQALELTAEASSRGVQVKDLTKAQRQAALARAKAPTADEAHAAVLATTGAAAATDTARKGLDATASERALVTDEAANPLSDVDRISGAQAKAGKQLGAQHAEIAGNLNASRAEAARDGVMAGTAAAAAASASRSGRSSTIDATKRAAAAIGAEQATLNAATTQPISAAEHLETTESDANIRYAEEAAKTRGTLTEQRRAQAKVQDTAKLAAQDQAIAAAEAAKGSPLTAAERAAAKAGVKPLSAEEAQSRLMATAAVGAQHAARSTTGKAYEEAAGAAAGVDRGITNIQNAAAARGEVLTKDEARDRMYRTISGTAERTGYNKIIGEVAEARGIQEARGMQREAARKEIATRDGKDTGAVSDTEVDELIDRAGDAKATKDARDRVVASTAQEIGTLRHEEAAVVEGAEAVLKEANSKIDTDVAAAVAAAKAKNPGLDAAGEAAVAASARAAALVKHGYSATEAANAARQNLITNKVRKGAGDTDATLGAEVGRDRSAVNVRDAQERQEIASTLSGATTFAPGEHATVGQTTQLTHDAQLAEAGMIDPDSEAELAAAAAFNSDVTLADGSVLRIGESKDTDAAGNPIIKLAAGTKVAGGTVIPAGARVKAGAKVAAGTTLTDTTLPDGTKVAGDTAIPAGNQLTPAAARARISGQAIAAGLEEGVRTQVAASSRNAALAEANAQGTASIDTRLTTGYQSVLEGAATEAAQVDAAGSFAPRDFTTAKNDAQSVAQRAELTKRVAQARRRVLPQFHGATVEEIELSVEKGSGNVPLAAEAIRQAYQSGDQALAIALSEKLRGSAGGEDAFIDQVRNRRLRDGGAGGTPFTTTSDSKFKETNDLGAVNSKAKDAKKPMVAALTSVSPKELATTAPQEVRRMLDTLNRPKEWLAAGYDDQNYLLHDRVYTPEEIASGRAEEIKSAARAEIKHLDDIAGAGDPDKAIWLEQRKKFADTVEKMFELEEKGQIQDLKPDVVRQLAATAKANPKWMKDALGEDFLNTLVARGQALSTRDLKPAALDTDQR